MSRIEEQIKAVQEESEATRDDPYPEGAVPTRPGQAQSVVQSVRLPAEAFAEIERIAREADVPVGALIRSWVLAGLAAERDTTLTDAVERLAADLDRLRRLAAERAA